MTPEPICWGLKEIRLALCLSTNAQADALFNDPTFPGVEIDGRKIARPSDVREWFNRRFETLLAEQRPHRIAGIHMEIHNEETKREPVAERTPRNQAAGSHARRDQEEALVLWPDLRRGGKPVSGVPESRPSAKGRRRNHSVVHDPQAGTG